jgi:hypothetical protein
MPHFISSRLGAAAGAVGAVVYVASAFSAGSPLKPDAPISKIVTHLSDKRGALLAGVVLAVIGVGLLLWFLSYLRAFLAEIEGGGAPLAGVTMASWVTLLVIVAAGATPLAAVIWRGAGGVNPQIARLAFDTGNLSLYSLSAPAAMLSVLAPSVVIWRSGALPRWLVLLGSIEIVVNVAELAGLFIRTGSNAAGYVWGIGPFIWVVWVAAVSVAMLLKAPGKSAAVAVSAIDVSAAPQSRFTIP